MFLFFLFFVYAFWVENKNVRFWTHTNEWVVHKSYYFDEQPLCFDLHPSAIQLAIGFPKAFRIYLVMEDKLVLVFTKPTQASLVIKYNHGGNFLAIGKFYFLINILADSSKILIMQSMTYRIICTLEGHNGLIRCITWGKYDNILVSTCNGGNIFIWDAIFTEGQSHSSVLPLLKIHNHQVIFTQVEFDPILGITFGITTENSVIKIIPK